MPFIEQSSYRTAPPHQFNGHLQTILPSLFRKIELDYHRERLELPDGDFLDLDWVYNQSNYLAIITHGLEGSAQRMYVKGMAQLFSHKGFDVLAWNCRSCSEEMNRTFKLYHHGDVEDITHVVNHAIKSGAYEKVVLIGFSMGGNINLKYLGVNAGHVPSSVVAAVAFSVPGDLKSSSDTLDKRSNFLYRDKFLRRLRIKIEKKANQFPGTIDLSNFEKIRRWRDFDEFYSAPLNNYENAEQFYWESSANNFIPNIKIPTLLVNAQNDPILTPECSRRDLADQNEYFFLETPRHGGHVGFSWLKRPFNWAEWRAWNFVGQYL